MIINWKESVMKKRGFTLIEMLAVILVLALLMGMLVRLFPNISRQSEKAVTIKKLNKVAYAINEFYAEYGTYPPVSGTSMAVEDFAATQEEFPMSMPYYTGIGATEPPRTYGLMAYLTQCPPPGATTKLGSEDNESWLEDEDVDSAAKTKWWPFIEDIITYYSGTNNGTGGAGISSDFIEKGVTVRDGWNRDIQYECKAPYTSYKLWSLGANAGSDQDDIYVDKME